MFFCAFRPDGSTLHRSDLFGPTAQLRRRTEAEPTTILDGPFAMVCSDPARAFRPLVAQWRHVSAAGDVRLDNRAEIARLCAKPVSPQASDLEVVLRAIDARGEKVIPALLGDFGFVLWDARARKLLAVRDAFGVKPLYYRRERGQLLIASRMDLLASSQAFDLDHIADLLTGLAVPQDRTIWSNVRPVPAGGFLVQRGTVAEGRRFWSADGFTPAGAATEREYAEQFLTLFREGVRTRLAAPDVTWSQLSGGLDSSSVVSMAHALHGDNALAGTVTVVDSLGNGDERRYSDVVVRRFGLRNEQLRDYWAWQDDGHAPPETEGPRPLYAFYARDRRMLDVVRKAGGRVLLSGFGSDHYLMGNLGYIADLASRGRVAAAVREVAAWSIGARQSFWTMLREQLVRPLSPFRAHRHANTADLPAWLTPGFISNHQLTTRLADAHLNTRMGSRFGRRTTQDLRAIAMWVDRWPFGDDVEVRYPFLYRPLVEAALRMPVPMRIRPEGTKWVLREAMRGLLPEEIRRRSGKGAIDTRIVWSLQRERHRIDELLRDPILAQLGCIEPGQLRRTVESARRGTERNLVYLMSALSLETWLAVRAGRWTDTTAAAATAA
jgi:asparagine synthase (glutamine-hydrolysing)